MSPDLLEAGEIRLGNFIAERPLGRGGMAEVWLGRHEASGAPVALKVMTAENLRSEAFLRAFAAEVRSVARLDHPGIIRLYDVGTVPDQTAADSEGRMAAGSPYLVMEYADGESLHAAPPPCEWEAVRDVLVGILRALAHAHARGVIHRDIKPGNVLWSRPLSPGGPRRVVLTDFGIAHAGEGGSSGQPTWGTPAYMAPERFTLEWRDLGPWTDLYSVGCLAFTLLRGRPPFKGTPLTQAMQSHLYRPVPSLRAECLVPKGLDAWLRVMLAKRPDERLANAMDAVAALENLGAPETRPSTPPGSASESSATLSRPPQSLIPQSVAPQPGEPLSNPAADHSHPTVAAADITWTDGNFDPSVLSGDTVHKRRATRRRPRRRQRTPMPEDWRAGLHPDLPVELPGGGLRLFGLRVARLVGREHERDALWAALLSVHRRGRPQGVLLRGPLGSGKTRLAQWVGEHAAELGAAIPMRADHGPGQGVPALARMVADQLRVGGLGPRALRSRVLGWLQSQGMHDDFTCSELVAVAQLGTGLPLTAGDEPRDLRLAVRRFLDLMARDRPIVLHLDDIPWGPTSLSFATELLEADRRRPILLVMTARDETLAAHPQAAATLTHLVGEGTLAELPIRALEGAQRRALVHNLLGVDRTLAATVAGHTQGNPLFTVTLVRDWVARGALMETPTGLALRPGQQPPLPADIDALWARRLADLLGETDSAWRIALELAAALGEAVEDREWAAVCELAEPAAPDPHQRISR